MLTVSPHTRREPIDFSKVRFGMAVAAARGGLALPSINSRDPASSDDNAIHAREVNLDSRSMMPGNEMEGSKVTDEGVSFLRYPRDIPVTTQVGCIFLNIHRQCVHNKSTVLTIHHGGRP
jgi:hypothetical protein